MRINNIFLFFRSLFPIRIIIKRAASTLIHQKDVSLLVSFERNLVSNSALVSIYVCVCVYVCRAPEVNVRCDRDERESYGRSSEPVDNHSDSARNLRLRVDFVARPGDRIMSRALYFGGWEEALRREATALAVGECAIVPGRAACPQSLGRPHTRQTAYPDCPVRPLAPPHFRQAQKSSHAASRPRSAFKVRPQTHPTRGQHPFFSTLFFSPFSSLPLPFRGLDNGGYAQMDRCVLNRRVFLFFLFEKKFLIK